MSLEKAELIEMLHKMILIREFDELAIALRTEGKIMGAVHPYVGEEAVAVGACSALRLTDRVTSTHRGHGHCIAKGADIKRMMAELFGRVDGYCKGKGGSMHIADFSVGMLGANGIVAGGMPIACGAALAAQLEGNGGVTACFFGDGATGEGEFHEALNMSSLWKLPLIFVCENNQMAAGNFVDATRAQPDISLHAAAYGMPGELVDGNDVVAVHDATQEAVARARAGHGPSLLVCRTFRSLFHAMRNAPPPETRPAALLAEWSERDPIDHLESALKAQELITDTELAAIRSRIERDLAAAVAFADASPFPDPSVLLDDMFAA